MVACMEVCPPKQLKNLGRHTPFDSSGCAGMTEVMEPHAPKPHVNPSPKNYCFLWGSQGSHHFTCHIIPIIQIILFRYHWYCSEMLPCETWPVGHGEAVRRIYQRAFGFVSIHSAGEIIQKSIHELKNRQKHRNTVGIKRLHFGEHCGIIITALVPQEGIAWKRLIR